MKQTVLPINDSSASENNKKIFPTAMSKIFSIPAVHEAVKKVSKE